MRFLLILNLFIMVSCKLAFKAAELEGREKTLIMGGRHTCVTMESGKTDCWGDNKFGQIGNSSDALMIRSPSTIDLNFLPVNEHMKALSLAYQHSCILTNQDNIYCWGRNNFTQIGTGPEITFSSTPLLVDRGEIPSGQQIERLYTGGGFNCILTNSNDAFCWGNNTGGELGNNDNSISLTPEPVAIDQSSLMPDEYFVDLGTGYRHSCGLTNKSKVYCWGDNEHGQIGQSAFSSDFFTPTEIDFSFLDANDNPAKLFSGYYSNCVITKLNKTFCWGSNVNGEMGIGVVGGKYDTPTLLTSHSSPDNYFVSISLGFYYACGVTNSQNIYCWGRNSRGQLGDNSLVDKSIPTAIELDTATTKFKTVKAGDYHSCGITTKGLVYCWGDNREGQLAHPESIVQSLHPIKLEF
jgi:alpha-tubulin suppressor-like RCC1 family protein